MSCRNMQNGFSCVGDWWNCAWGSISCALSVSETKGNSIAVAAFAQNFFERRDNNIAVWLVGCFAQQK